MASNASAIVQSTRSIPGTEVAYTDNIYKPTHYSKLQKAVVGVVCKAIENLTTSTLTVVLHRVDDYHTDGTKRYSTVKVPAEGDKAVLFDEVHETGTSALATGETANANLIPE